MDWRLALLSLFFLVPTSRAADLSGSGGAAGGISQAAADARYVELSGDTMTGALALEAAPLTVSGSSLSVQGIIKTKDRIIFQDSTVNLIGEIGGALVGEPGTTLIMRTLGGGTNIVIRPAGTGEVRIGRNISTFTASGNLIVPGGVDSGSSTVRNALVVVGTSTFQGAALFETDVVLEGAPLTVSGSSLTVDGLALFTSSITVNGTLDVSTIINTAGPDGYHQASARILYSTLTRVAVGLGAGAKNKGERTAYVGVGAGENHEANDSAFFGWHAGFDQVLGGLNTYLGTLSGEETTGGGATNNTYVGYGAGDNRAGGGFNTFLGSQAGKHSGATSTGNVFIGAGSGENNSGASNVFLGFRTGKNSGTTANMLYIANDDTDKPLIHGDFAASSVTINGRFTVTDSVSVSSAIIINQGDTSHTSAFEVADIGVNDENYIVAITSINNTTVVWAVHPNGHIQISGEDPTLGTCNNGTINTNSSDSAGIIAISGSNSSCAINFAATWDAQPLCFCSTIDSAPSTCRIDSLTTTVLTVSPSSTLGSGDSYTYHCIGLHAE